MKIFKNREEKIKDLKAKIKLLEANNLILLENAEESRKQLRFAERIIESLKEENQSLVEESYKNIVKEPVKKGRKKKEPTK